MSYRSARLEAIFGLPLDRLDSAAVHGLVDTEAAEAFDLDFKRELYGTSDADRRALATDVAAFANGSGGVVLLGVAEDEQARAAETAGVALSDAEQRRMTQIIAGNVAPVPRFDVRALPEPNDPTRGFYAIMVERTPAAPHAVVVGDNLRFPRRNGATTRYLTEPEVAQAYRDRLGALNTQQDRLDDVLRRGCAVLDTTEQVYVALAAVPEVPGVRRMDRAAFAAFQEDAQLRRPTIVGLGLSSMRRFVDHGRFSSDGASGDAALSSWHRQDVYGDGSTFFALVVGRARGDTTIVGIDDEHLVIGVLSALVEAGRSAGLAGASGSAWLRASVVHGPGTSVELTHGRGQFGGGSWHGGVRASLTEVDAVGDVDALLSPGPPLVATAASLCDGIYQTLGVAECFQLAPDGRIRLPYFVNNRKPLVQAWADANGIEAVMESVD